MRFYGIPRRIVIDTNVIVSALIKPDGKAADFFNNVLDGQYEVVVTNSIFEEYCDVLNRPKFHLSPVAVEFVLNWIRDNSFWVEVDENDYPKEEMPDSDDAAFYVVARSTGALLVTKNVKHYPVTEWRTMIWELL